MPLLQPVPVETAEGEVKENYDMFLKTMGMVPRPFEMWSISPGLQSIQKQFIGHYIQHPTISMGLTAFIRMLVSEEMGFEYCISFNANVLKGLGVTSDDQVAEILADPTKAPLPNNERAMLLFVLKVCKTPKDVTKQDIDDLKAMGWTEKDIFEASSHGTGMISMGTMFQAFQMGDGASC